MSDTKITGTAFFIMQYVEHWNNISRDEVRELCKTSGAIDYGFILHDKDVNDNGELKQPHFHIWVRYKKNTCLTTVASHFGLERQYVERCRRENNCVGYLVHINAENKFQYDISEIVSNLSESELKNILDRVKANQQDSKADNPFTFYRDKIQSGEITEYNFHSFISMKDYDIYKKRINNCFEYLKLKNGMGANRNMNVMYVYGDSGTGKTTFAKQLCRKMGFGEPYISSSDNDLLDGYLGQPCIILDDLRAEDVKFSNFLKLCDNNTSSSFRSRYFNKSLSNCRLLIITTLHSPDLFFKDFNTRFEQKFQFDRRLGAVFYIQSSELKSQGLLINYQMLDSVTKIVIKTAQMFIPIDRTEQNQFVEKLSKVLDEENALIIESVPTPKPLTN